jgi:hypothetical protein
MTQEHTDSFMRMPANWLEWLGVISSVLAIREYFKRKSHDDQMVGFLHGIKPLVESMRTTGAVWGHLVTQIDDMLGYLRPPRLIARLKNLFARRAR